MALRKLYTITEIVNRMITRMTANTGITDFTPGSNIRTMFETVAVFIEYIQFLVEEAYRSFYVDTATGQDLDRRIRDFGMSRKEARNATGVVSFIRNQYSPDTFYIYAGSQVSTQPDTFGNTISFRLLNDIVFPASTQQNPITQVTGIVVCESSGPIGNIIQGKITNITSIIPGIDSVTNPKSFMDGSKAETDDQLRKRLPIFINGLKRGNEDAIKSAVLAIPGISYVKLKSNSPTAGYNTIYVSTQGVNGGLSEQQIIEVKQAIEDSIAFGIKFQVSEPKRKLIKIKMSVEIDSDNYDKGLIAEEIKKSVTELVNTSSESELQVYDIILAADVPGVYNVKNVMIADANELIFSQRDFRPVNADSEVYVIRLNIDSNLQYANSDISIEFFDKDNDTNSLGVM